MHHNLGTSGHRDIHVAEIDEYVAFTLKSNLKKKKKRSRSPKTELNRAEKVRIHWRSMYFFNFYKLQMCMLDFSVTTGPIHMKQNLVHSFYISIVCEYVQMQSSFLIIAGNLWRILDKKKTYPDSLFVTFLRGFL